MSTPRAQTAEILAPPPVVYLAALVLGLAIHAIDPEPIFSPGWVLYGAGALLLVLSGGLARAAFVAMKRRGTSADPRKASAALTTDGPFRLSRNPIYVAMTGLYLGAALLANSLWLLLLVVPLLGVMHWGVILREERYLAQRFGDAYRHYASTTRRWL